MMKFKKALFTIIVFLSLVVLLTLPATNSVYAYDEDEDIVLPNNHNPVTAFVTNVVNGSLD